MAFLCSICQKSFSRKSNRDKHVALIHEKSGRFKCSVCTKAFLYPSSLKEHQRTHTREKPFACKSCQRRFARKRDLKNHQLGMRHLNCHSVKKFKCEICGRIFRFPSYFRRHLKVHSEDKPFKCDLCNFASKYKENLTIHQGIHSRRGQRGLARDDHPELAKRVEQSVGGGGSGAKDTLRVRRKTPTYRSGSVGVEAIEIIEISSPGNSEIGDHQNSGGEPSELDEASDREEVVVWDGLFYDQLNGDEVYLECNETAKANEVRPAKEYETISLSSDNEDGELSIPLSHSNSREVYPQGDKPAESNNRPAREYETITLSSDEMITLSSDDEDCELITLLSHSDDELPAESSTVIDANLKVVFDVEYRAPD